jgi:hypothetical protein
MAFFRNAVFRSRRGNLLQVGPLPVLGERPGSRLREVAASPAEGGVAL